MKRKERFFVFLLGAVPLGLLAAVLWPVGGYVTTAALMVVYQVLVQPWAMTGRSLRSLLRDRG